MTLKKVAETCRLTNVSRLAKLVRQCVAQLLKHPQHELCKAIQMTI